MGQLSFQVCNHTHTKLDHKLDTIYLEYKSKLRMVLSFFVTNLDVTSLLDGQSAQQWVQDRVY